VEVAGGTGGVAACAGHRCLLEGLHFGSRIR
jgi:hypothetical protein